MESSETRQVRASGALRLPELARIDEGDPANSMAGFRPSERDWRQVNDEGGAPGGSGLFWRAISVVGGGKRKKDPLESKFDAHLTSACMMQST